MHRRTALARAIAAGSALLAGCTDGGDTSPATGTDERTSTGTPAGDGTTTPTGTSTGTATASATDEPTATASPTDTPTATPTPSPQPDQKVIVENYQFVPDSFTIATGDTVLWVWENANAGHNVSPESQPSGANWPGNDESTYPSGHTYSYTFEVAGRYKYHCDPHQSSHDMRGSFTVQ